MTVRVAVFGAGSVATRHVRVLSGFGDARVVAVADPQRDAADRLAASCGATGYGDPERLLDAEWVDAVYVCVPPFAHGGPERAALDRGLPLFVEKPIAVDLPTAEALAARVAAAGVVTGTGYHWRCLDIVDRARALLADRPAGLALGYWLDKVPPPAWWRSRARSGGQLVEQATHVLDLARVLLGEVVSVYAETARTPQAWREHPDADVDDVTAVTLRFASGAVGTLAASCLLPRLYRAAVHTVSPGLALEVSDQELVVDTGAERQRHLPAVDPRVLVDREFLDAVQGRREGTRTPYAEAFATHRVACAATESASTGRPVRLSPEPGSGS
jgi:predicted dehydrogenase